MEDGNNVAAAGLTAELRKRLTDGVKAVELFVYGEAEAVDAAVAAAKGTVLARNAQGAHVAFSK